MDDMQHIIVVGIETLVNNKRLLAVAFQIRLIKNAQHLLQTVVYLPMQAGDLHYDAVVRKALDKWMGKATGDQIVVIVIGMTTDIENRFLNIANLVAKKIDRYHRNSIPLLALCQDVLRIGVVNTKILAEAKRLRLQPRLLKLNKHQMPTTIRLLYRCPKVYSENR